MPGDKQQSNRETFILALSVFAAAVVILTIAVYVTSDGETRLRQVQAIGGLGTLAAVIAVFWGFRYTKASIDNQAAQVENQSLQLSLEHESRIIDQFFRASTELSSEYEHARIAGLHTLESIALDYEDMFERVVHIITAFVRTRSKEVYRDHTPEEADLPTDEGIRTAMRVLRSLQAQRHLNWKQITMGFLDGAWFVSCPFLGADFQNWSFRGARFIHSNCIGTNLNGANLEDSFFGNLTFENTGVASAVLRNSTWTHILMIYSANNQYPWLDLDAQASGYSAPRNLGDAFRSVIGSLKHQPRVVVYLDSESALVVDVDNETDAPRWSIDNSDG